MSINALNGFEAHPTSNPLGSSVTANALNEPSMGSLKGNTNGFTENFGFSTDKAPTPNPLLGLDYFDIVGLTPEPEKKDANTGTDPNSGT